MSWDCKEDGCCDCVDAGYGCCYCDDEPSNMTENTPDGAKNVTDDVEAGG